MQHSVRNVLPAACGFAAALASLALAGDLITRYDASTGLLPGEMCWQPMNPNNAPPPALSRGALTFGPTGYGTASYFQHSFPPISFGDGAAIEASMKVDASTWYAGNPFKRTGFYLSLSDSAGKWAAIGVSSDRLLLATADQNWSDLTFLFNTTSAYHTYRLTIQGSVATVFIDGAPVLTDTVGSGATPNVANFGDLSILGSSTTRAQYVQVEGVPVCAIADIDCSGHVDGTDLAILIGAWGTALCEADLNDDANVDGQDLAILLGLWG